MCARNKTVLCQKEEKRGNYQVLFVCIGYGDVW